MLTLDKFEEASEKVKEVTLETKLIYSDFLSDQTGNKVYLKPENMQFTGAYKVRGAYYLFPVRLSMICWKNPFSEASGSAAKAVVEIRLKAIARDSNSESSFFGFMKTLLSSDRSRFVRIN